MKGALLRLVHLAGLAAVSAAAWTTMSSPSADPDPYAREVQMARRGNADQRTRAIGNLVGANATATAVVETLLDALHDPEAAVRVEASRSLAYVLQRGGTPEQCTVARSLLIDRIQDSDTAVREQAGFALVLLGDRTPAVLDLALEATRHGEPMDRHCVISTLLRHVPEQAITRQAIEEAARDGEPVLRVFAVQDALAWRLGSEHAPAGRVLSLLTEALEDTDPRVAAAAAAALGALGADAGPAVPALVSRLTEKYPFSTQMAAIDALGALGRSAADALPDLREVARTQAGPLRTAALEACQRIEATQSDATDDELLSDTPLDDEPGDAQVGAVMLTQDGPSGRTRSNRPAPPALARVRQPNRARATHGRAG